MFTFDPEKAVESIAYVADRTPIPDIYHVLKILYFADKYHLEKFGRFISGDTHVAMKSGPVPSSAYDIIKDVRGDGSVCVADHAKHVIAVGAEHRINVLRDVQTDLFSNSDIEALDSSIADYGHMTFGQLKNASHDAAYNAADDNDFIKVENIAATFENGDELIDYLRNAQAKL